MGNCKDYIVVLNSYTKLASIYSARVAFEPKSTNTNEVYEKTATQFGLPGKYYLISTMEVFFLSIPDSHRLLFYLTH